MKPMTLRQINPNATRGTGAPALKAKKQTLI